MSPSSPSNADAPGGAGYKIATRALTADLSAARTDESSRDLGTVDEPGLRALLEKLSALDPSDVAEADPQLVVSARRGRFTLRPGQGRILIRSATDGGQHYWEMAAGEVPDFLNGKEIPEAPTTSAPEAVVVVHPVETKLALALSLFAAAVLIVAISAWLTFRPNDWDPESMYDPIAASAEAEAQRKSAVGLYGNGGGDDERTLEIDARGHVRYREYGPGRELADDRSGPATLARRRADRALVLRVTELGTIELKDPDTIVFARDAYQRRGPTDTRATTP